MTQRSDLIIKALLDRCGRLYAEEAGLRLADRPGPLYGADLLISRWRGDLRRPRDETGGAPGAIASLLTEVPRLTPRRD